MNFRICKSKPDMAGVDIQRNMSGFCLHTVQCTVYTVYSTVLYEYLAHKPYICCCNRCSHDRLDFFLRRYRLSFEHLRELPQQSLFNSEKILWLGRGESLPEVWNLSKIISNFLQPGPTMWRVWSGWGLTLSPSAGCRGTSSCGSEHSARCPAPRAA